MHLQVPERPEGWRCCCQGSPLHQQNWSLSWGQLTHALCDLGSCPPHLSLKVHRKEEASGNSSRKMYLVHGGPAPAWLPGLRSYVTVLYKWSTHRAWWIAYAPSAFLRSIVTRREAPGTKALPGTLSPGSPPPGSGPGAARQPSVGPCKPMRGA